MPQVFYILLGFLATVLSAWALGRHLFRSLGLAFHRVEEHALAFVTGSAVLSLLVFVFCSLHQAYKGLFLAFAAALLVHAWYTGAFRGSTESFAPLPRLWSVLLILIGAAFTWLYFFNALAPEYSADGSTYHLGLVARYLRERGFTPITTNIYANLSQGVEMLFLFAFSIGRHSAAALVHFAFLLTLPVLVLCYGRRIGEPAAGAAAALFVYACPVAGLDGTIAYIDVAVATILFALFYLLQIWDESRNPRLLIPIGLLAGFGYAAKYTAFLAVPYALGFVLWRLLRRRKPFLKPLAVVSLCALLLIAPWVVKNILWVGNPFSPFLNSVFDNPNVHVSFEQDYARHFRTYGLSSPREIPFELTLRGEKLTGILGPLFLLSPLALISLRKRAGRRVMFAAALFALTWFGNIGTRFLLPALPFLALSLALAFTQVRYLLPALVLLHAIASWPPVLSLYCAPTGWRLVRIPIAAALRRVPEEQFLVERLPEYLIARSIERHTPPGSTIFSFGQIAEAYTTRNILVNYQGALNERLMRTLWLPMAKDFQPRHARVFHFSPGHYRRLRAIETARVEPDTWSITEIRAYLNGHELSRANWSATARPNPWDAPLALDGSPVTQWRTWRFLEPGQRFELDLGQPTLSDELRLVTSSDHWRVELRLEGQDASGRWHALAEKAELVLLDPPPGLRRLATAEVKSHGINYLLVHEGSYGQDDFRDRADEWGILLIEHINGADLYLIR